MEIASSNASNGLFTPSVNVKQLAHHQIPVFATFTDPITCYILHAIFCRHLNRTARAKVVSLITEAAGLQWRKHLMILLHSHSLIAVIRVTQKTKVK